MLSRNAISYFKRQYFDSTWEYNSTWFYSHSECRMDSKIIIEVNLITEIGMTLLKQKVTRTQSYTWE